MTRITIADIQKRIHEEWTLPAHAMTMKGRRRFVARPRQIAMYLCRKLTKNSLPLIGQRFGGRDHSTVVHACRVVEHLMTTDPRLGERIEAIEFELKSAAGICDDLTSAAVYEAQRKASEAGAM